MQPTFIHGNLTLDNIALSDEHRLQGVFDFASGGIGDIHEELGCVTRIDPVVFESCIQTLQAAGIKVKPEDAWLWRELRDFHVPPGWIMLGNTQHEIFIRVRDVIAQRYPHIDWSELYR